MLPALASLFFRARAKWFVAPLFVMLALLISYYVPVRNVAQAQGIQPAATAVISPAMADEIAALAPAPALPPGWINVFAVLAPRQVVTVGTQLGAGCAVTALEFLLPPGPPPAGGSFLFRTAAPGQPYLVSNYLKRLVITCPPIHGLALHGDQDPKVGELPTIWRLIGALITEWTPPTNPDNWDVFAFEAVTTIEILGRGDSGEFGLYVNPTATNTPTPTATPTSTPTTTPATPTFTPTATATDPARITLTKVITSTKENDWAFVFQLATLAGGSPETRVVTKAVPATAWENLTPGTTYVLSEQTPGAPWSQGNFACAVGGQPTGVAEPNGPITLAVNPGDNIICTKNNVDTSGTSLPESQEPPGASNRLYLPIVNH